MPWMQIAAGTSHGRFRMRKQLYIALWELTQMLLFILLCAALVYVTGRFAPTKPTTKAINIHGGK